MNWRELENETTLDLIETMGWSSQPGYEEAAEAAFRVFTFRFRSRLAPKCEIRCKKWGYDADAAIEIVYRTFARFYKYPHYNQSKSKSIDIDTGVLLYLCGIAENELVKFCNEKDSSKANPYSGNEEIVFDMPSLDNVPLKNKRELERMYNIVNEALNRLSHKHKIIYLTYKAHEVKGHKLPRHLLESLRDYLELTQNSIRFYKNEAFNTVGEYLKIYGSK